MNACKDCRYAMRTPDNSEFWKCLHPKAFYDHSVTGQRAAHYCSTERIAGCGPEGARFEPLRDEARKQAEQEYEAK